MQDLNDKITGNVLPASEWNQIPSEMQNVIEGLGINLSGGDLNQLGKAIAGYAANGTFYTDSGTPGSYVLSSIGSKQSPPSYSDGFKINFRTTNPNPSSIATVNVSMLGVKDIKLPGGSDVSPGQISGVVECIFDAANDWFEIQVPPVSIISHSVLSDAIADNNLNIGDFVSVEDYATGNNSGVLFFSVVPGGTGSPDGGSYINTDSGLQLKQNFLKGYVSVKQFGSTGNGIDDDQPTAANCISYGVNNGIPVYWPTPTVEYLLDRDGFQIRALTMTRDFVMFGDGVTSKIKRGDNTANGDFREMFFFRNAEGSQVNITIRDLFIDDNAAGSATPPSPFDYEHSHCITMQPLGARGFTEIRLENITIKDPVADGCNVGGGAINYVGNIICDSFRLFDRNRVRSDITVTCSYDKLLVSNCPITKFEVETNSVAADSLGELVVSNMITDSFDIIFKDRATPATINGLICSGFLNFEGHNATFNGGIIKLSEAARLLGDQDNTIQFNGTQFDTIPGNTDTQFLYVGSVGTSPKLVEFNDCKMRNTGGAANLTDFWEDPNTGFEGRLVRFRNTQFECTDTMTSATFHRSGEYEFKDCEFSGDITGDSYIRGSTANLPITHSLRAFNNFINQAGKFLYEPPEASTGSAVQIWMKGNVALDGTGSIIGFTRYDKIAPPLGGDTVLNFRMIDTFDSVGIPTSGRYPLGTKVYNILPVALGNIGWVATANGTGAAATFKEFGVIEA